jgi:hypothetical protein
MIPTILTKEGAAYFKEMSLKRYDHSSDPNDTAYKLVMYNEFERIKQELDEFLEEMKEKREDLYRYNVLMDKYSIIKSTLTNSKYEW